MGQQRKLVKVIQAFDMIGQRTIIIFLSYHIKFVAYTHVHLANKTCHIKTCHRKLAGL
jgi:hypothetical protein